MPLETVTKTLEKGVTLHQPWATMIARGHKTIETRSWPTRHRGPLAIHAARRLEGDHIEAILQSGGFKALGAARQKLLLHDLTSSRYPLGCVVAVCNVVDVVKIDPRFDADGNVEPYTLPTPPGSIEYALGDYRPGRYAWILEDVRVLERPVVVRGQQALWDLPPQARLDIAQTRLGVVTPEGVTFE